MAVPASVGQNTQIINLCDLTESDDEHMSAPASSSGGALVPALANAKKQRQPKRSDAELIEVYKQDKKDAQERKQTAINNNNKSGKKKAAEQVKGFALKLKKAQIRKKNATAKDKKKRARSKKPNAVKKPRAARKPKVLVVASVEINEADDVGAVDSSDHVMNDVGAAADVAEPGSPLPDMPESKPLGKEVVPAFSAGKWHHDVDVLFKKLEKDAKLKMDKLDEETLNALKKLPYEVALLCLGKVRDEKPVIRDMNAFIVKNAAHLRNQWGLDDAASNSSSEDEDEDEESDSSSSGEDEDEESNSDHEERDREAAKRRRQRMHEDRHGGHGGIAGGRA